MTLNTSLSVIVKSMLSPQNDKEKSPKIPPNDHSNHILLATIVSFNYSKYFFDIFFLVIEISIQLEMFWTTSFLLLGNSYLIIFKLKNNIHFFPTMEDMIFWHLFRKIQL